MVTTFYPPHAFGGDAVAVERLSRALAKRGHHVSVIYDADVFHALSGEAPLPPPEPVDGIEIHALTSAMASVSALLTQQLGRPVLQRRAIRRLLHEGRFDVINHHNVSLVGGPGVLREGTALKAYMAHEHWLVCPTHVLSRSVVQIRFPTKKSCVPTRGAAIKGFG